MKSMVIAMLTVLSAMVFAGCGSPSVTTKFDSEGKVVEVTESNESAVKTVVESTKNKLVLLSDQSYLYGLRFIPPGSSSENPLGIFELVFGRQDKILLTVPMDKVQDTALGTAAIQSLVQASRAGEITLSTTGATEKR